MGITPHEIQRLPELIHLMEIKFQMSGPKYLTCINIVYRLNICDWSIQDIARLNHYVSLDVIVHMFLVEKT